MPDPIRVESPKRLQTVPASGYRPRNLLGRAGLKSYDDATASLTAGKPVTVKAAAEARESEPIRDLIYQALLHEYRADPQAMAAAGLTGAPEDVDVIAASPSRLAQLLARYGTRINAPSVVDLAARIGSGAESDAAYADRDAAVQTGTSTLDTVGNLASPFLPGALGQAANWVPNLLGMSAVPAARRLPLSVSRPETLQALPRAQAEIDYRLAQDAVAKAGTPEAAAQAQAVLAEKEQALRSALGAEAAAPTPPGARTGTNVLGTAANALGAGTGAAISGGLGPVVHGVMEPLADTIGAVTGSQFKTPMKQEMELANNGGAETGAQQAARYGLSGVQGVGHAAIARDLITKGLSRFGAAPLAPGTGLGAGSRALLAAATKTPGGVFRAMSTLGKLGVRGAGLGTLLATGAGGALNTYTGMTDAGQERIQHALDQQVVDRSRSGAIGNTLGTLGSLAGPLWGDWAGANATLARAGGAPASLEAQHAVVMGQAQPIAAELYKGIYSGLQHQFPGADPIELASIAREQAETRSLAQLGYRAAMDANGNVVGLTGARTDSARTPAQAAEDTAWEQAYGPVAGQDWLRRIRDEAPIAASRFFSGAGGAQAMQAWHQNDATMAPRTPSPSDLARYQNDVLDPQAKADAEGVAAAQEAERVRVRDQAAAAKATAEAERVAAKDKVWADQEQRSKAFWAQHGGGPGFDRKTTLPAHEVAKRRFGADWHDLRSAALVPGESRLGLWNPALAKRLVESKETYTPAVPTPQIQPNPVVPLPAWQKSQDVDQRAKWTQKLNPAPALPKPAQPPALAKTGALGATFMRTATDTGLAWW